LRLVVKVPPDASMLSTMLYEGLAYVISTAGGDVRPNPAGPGLTVELPDDAIVQSYVRVAQDGEGIERIRIATTPNDGKSVNKLLEMLGVNAEGFWPEKKGGGKAAVAPYGRLIGAVAEAAVRNPDAILKLGGGGVIEIGVRLGRNEIIIGSGGPALSLALFKSCDKYGSMRVWEFGPISAQVGQKLSPAAALICMLGLYSSYVDRVGNVNFLLPLDPAEVAEALNALQLLNTSPAEAISVRLEIRDVGRDVIREFTEAAVMPPAILSRLALSVKLSKAFEGSRLEALRMRLVKVVEEGRIYKIYEDLPVEARREPYVRGALSRELSEHVSPKSPLMRCVTQFVRKGLGRAAQLCEENDHVLKAVEALYRLVALKDVTALSDYVRILRDAADALESAAEGGASLWRARTYRRWVARLDWAIAELIKAGG